MLDFALLPLFRFEYSVFLVFFKLYFSKVTLLFPRKPQTALDLLFDALTEVSSIMVTETTPAIIFRVPGSGAGRDLLV